MIDWHLISWKLELFLLICSPKIQVSITKVNFVIDISIPYGGVKNASHHNTDLCLKLNAVERRKPFEAGGE